MVKFLIILLGFMLGGLANISPAQNLSAGSPSELHGKRGEILLITVKAPQAGAVVSGKFLGRAIPFFRSSPLGDFSALLGIDLSDETAMHKMEIHIQNPGLGPKQNLHLSRQVRVQSGHYRREEFSVPAEKDTFDEKTLKRIRGEKKLILSKLNQVSPNKLWRGNFLVPVEGRVSNNFGSQRIINGAPRNPHNGEDISAAAGTPVKASNHGTVTFVGEQYFSGKGVLIDHGLGLFSMYFHLSKILIKEGAIVTKGQIIGEVGASGRATGPHLHWGIRLNGSRVNPFSLSQLPLESP